EGAERLAGEGEADPERGVHDTDAADVASGQEHGARARHVVAASAEERDGDGDERIDARREAGEKATDEHGDEREDEAVREEIAAGHDPGSIAARGYQAARAASGDRRCL